MFRSQIKKLATQKQRSAEGFMEELQDRIKSRSSVNPNLNFLIKYPADPELHVTHNTFSALVPVAETEQTEEADPKNSEETQSAETGETKRSSVSQEQQQPDAGSKAPLFKVPSPDLVEKRQQLCDELYSLCLQAKVRVDTIRGRRMVECKILTALQAKLGKFYAQLAQEMVEQEKKSVELSYIGSFFYSPEPEPETVAEIEKYQTKMAAGNFDLEDKFFEVSTALSEKYPGVLPVPSSFDLMNALH